MKKIIYILFILTLFSCKKASSSKFAGNWQGIYTGADDHGTFLISIDDLGDVGGSATSIVFAETYQLIGAVNSNGTITLTFGSATSGGTFTGTLHGTSASGTWENSFTNPAFTGTWTGQKQ